MALTGFGRGMSLTTRAARKLPTPVEVYELDVTMEEQADQVALELGNRWGGLDGVVHAIGFAPESCLGNGVLVAGWKDVATAVEVSAYSLKVLAAAFAPLLSRAAGGGSIVGLTSTRRRRWSRSPATSPATWDRMASGSTSSQRARSARWQRGRYPVSSASRACGTRVPRSDGTFGTPGQSHGPAWLFCRTGSRERPGRSSTLTAGSTPLGPERPYQPPTSSRKDERFGRLGSDPVGVLVPGVGATGRTATAGTGGLPDPRQIKSSGYGEIHEARAVAFAKCKACSSTESPRHKGSGPI